MSDKKYVNEYGDIMDINDPRLQKLKKICNQNFLSEDDDI